MFYIRHYQHSNKGLGEGWWGSVHSAVTEQSSAATHLLSLNLYLYLFTCTHFNYSRRWCIIRNSSHRTVTVSSENELPLALRGTSAVRGTFRHMMEKDRRKSNLKLILVNNKNAQKCVKTTKKEKSEHVRRLLHKWL